MEREEKGNDANEVSFARYGALERRRDKEQRREHIESEFISISRETLELHQIARFFFFFFFFFVVVVSPSTPEERSPRVSPRRRATHTKREREKNQREREKKKKARFDDVPGTTRARRTICTRSNPSRPVPWRKARSTPTLRLSPPGTRPGGRRCTRRINYYSLLLLYILLLRYYYKRRRPMGSLSRVQKRGCEEKAIMRPEVPFFFPI